MMNKRKKWYQKYLAGLIIALLAFSITACSSGKVSKPANNSTSDNNEVSTTTSAPPTETTNTTEVDKDSSSTTGTEAWKQFLKDYEAWTDKYVEFMKKYKANPSDLSIIKEYGQFATETAEWSTKAQKYQDELNKGNVSPEIISEYLNTLSRITKKLAEVAY